MIGSAPRDQFEAVDWIRASLVGWTGSDSRSGGVATAAQKILPSLLLHHVSPCTPTPRALASARAGSILNLGSGPRWRGRPPIPALDRRSNGEREPPVPQPPRGDLQPSGSLARAPAGVLAEPCRGLRACAAWRPPWPPPPSLELGKEFPPGLSACAREAAGGVGPAPGPSPGAPRPG